MCLGLRFECLAEHPRVTPGSDLGVRVQVHNGGPEPVEVERLDLELPAGWSAARGENGTFIVAVPRDAPPRAPYWLRRPHGPYRYVWPPDAMELGRAVDEPLIVAVAKVRVDGCLLELRFPAVERSGFSGGARALPVTVVPPIALVPRERRAILPVSEQATLLECDVLVQCIEPDGASGAVRLTAPEGWAVAPTAAGFAFARGGESETLVFRVPCLPGTPGHIRIALRRRRAEPRAARWPGGAGAGRRALVHCRGEPCQAGHGRGRPGRRGVRAHPAIRLRAGTRRGSRRRSRASGSTSPSSATRTLRIPTCSPSTPLSSAPTRTTCAAKYVGKRNGSLITWLRAAHWSCNTRDTDTMNPDWPRTPSGCINHTIA